MAYFLPGLDALIHGRDKWEQPVVIAIAIRKQIVLGIISRAGAKCFITMWYLSIESGIDWEQGQGNFLKALRGERAGSM